MCRGRWDLVLLKSLSDPVELGVSADCLALSVHTWKALCYLFAVVGRGAHAFELYLAS